MLFRANYDANKVNIDRTIHQLKRGQFITSQLNLSYYWLWGRTSVRSFLSMLEREQMIKIETTNKMTIITICNYDSYQLSQPAKNHPSNNSQPSTEQPPNIENKVNKENKDKKKKTGLVFEFDDSGLNEKYREWVEYRAEHKKPLKQSTVDRQITALQKLSVQKAINTINRSMMNQWQGLFPESEKDKSESFPDVWDLHAAQKMDLHTYTKYCQHLISEGFTKISTPGRGTGEKYIKEA